MLNKFLATSSGSVTFTVADLSAFNTNTPIYFQIVFSNSKSVKLAGVTHGFNNNIMYNKVSYLK